MGYRERVDKRIVIGGGSGTVRDQLKLMLTEFRIRNLLLMVQMGSMSHELVLKKIDPLGREVLPGIRGPWEDDWEHEWWSAPFAGRMLHGPWQPGPRKAWEVQHIRCQPLSPTAA